MEWGKPQKTPVRSSYRDSNGVPPEYVWNVAATKAYSSTPGPLGKANSLPAGQHISRMLWNTVHYRVHMSSLFVFFIRWLHSTYSHPVSIRCILILSSLLRVDLTSCIFPCRLTVQNFAIHSMHSVCFADHAIPNLIMWESFSQQELHCIC
jgi:hypothetical protein